MHGSTHRTLCLLWKIYIASKFISDWEHILCKCGDKNCLAACLCQQPRGTYGFPTMPDTKVTAVVDNCHFRHRHMLCTPHRTFNSSSCKICHLHRTHWSYFKWIIESFPSGHSLGSLSLIWVIWGQAWTINYSHDFLWDVVTWTSLSTWPIWD